MSRMQLGGDADFNFTKRGGVDVAARRARDSTFRVFAVD